MGGAYFPREGNGGGHLVALVDAVKEALISDGFNWSCTDVL